MDKRIFIVDDDPYWTALLTIILEDLGYRNIKTFSNGTECIENLHLNPGLVFLDYQMDGINGIEVLKKIKSYYPGIGVIFCTAFEDLAVAVDAMEYGSYDYLLKGNVSIKEVSDLIQNITSQKFVSLN